MRALPRPALLLIVDPERAGSALFEHVAAMCQAGLAWLSLRAKALPAEQQIDLFGRLREAAPGATLTLHGDPALAARAAADGVHLAADGPSVDAARSLLGPEALIGRSCHSEAAIRAAAAADYVTLSPVFPPNSKRDDRSILGLSGLSLGVQTGHSVIALGGIDQQRALACRQAGAAGVAVLGAVWDSEDPVGAIRQLIRAV